MKGTGIWQTKTIMLLIIVRGVVNHSMMLIGGVTNIQCNRVLFMLTKKEGNLIQHTASICFMAVVQKIMSDRKVDFN